MTKIAKFISLLLHPLLMPTYAMAVLLYTSLQGVLLLGRAKLILLLLVFLLTAILPLLFVAYLRWAGRVQSFSMRERSERVVPLLFGSGTCFVAYFSLQKIIRLHPLFAKLFLALAIFLVLLAIITKFWKISLHMAGIGGLLLVSFVVSREQNLLPILIFSAGLLGSARLWLKSHNLSQIFAGFSLGVCYFSGFFIF